MKKWNSENKEWRRNWTCANREKLTARAKERLFIPGAIEKKRASHAKWRSKNKAEENARWKIWYAANREKVLGRRKSTANKEQNALRSRERYQKIKNDPVFQRKNRANSKVGLGKRRAIELKAPVSELKLIRKYINRMRSLPSVSCYYCATSVSGSSIHIDHVVPLAKGGSHGVGNLCCACAPCNLKKNAKLPHEFAMLLSL